MLSREKHVTHKVRRRNQGLHLFGTGFGGLREKEKRPVMFTEGRGYCELKLQNMVGFGTMIHVVDGGTW